MPPMRWFLLLAVHVNVIGAHQLELVVEGSTRPLNDTQNAALLEKATEYVKSCWLSSLEIRTGSRGLAFEPDWAEEMSQNHVLLDFDPPLAVSTVDGKTNVNLALISLHLGQVLGRDYESEFRLLECSPKRFIELGCLEFLDGFVHDVPHEHCPTLLKIEDYVVENPQYLEIRNGIYRAGGNKLFIRDPLDLLEDADKKLISSVFEEGRLWIVGSGVEATGPKRAKAIVVLSDPLESPVDIHLPDGMTVLYYVNGPDVSVFPPNAKLAGRKIHLTQEGTFTYIKIGGTTTEFADWSINRK